MIRLSIARLTAEYFNWIRQGHFITKITKRSQISLVGLAKHPAFARNCKRTSETKVPVVLSFLFGARKVLNATEEDSLTDITIKMATPLADLIQNADQLFDENLYQEAYDVLKSHADPSLSEIQWRQARALYRLSKMDSQKARKEDLIREGFALVNDAVTKDEGNFATHKWMAVLLDAKCELDGIKERVSNLEKVKMHMERAVALNPEDATSYHLLGNFAFSLADMPWYQRKIVSAIFATPPSGTYEEALGHFLVAEEKKPGFYSMNILFIAKCYQRLKNDDKAKEYLTLAANIQVLNEDDKRCKEEASALLTKY